MTLNLKPLALATLAAASSQVFAHQTYNLTGVDVGMASSLNNTDGVSNTGGYAPVGVDGREAGDANANIPGTGGLPTDYTGALPYNIYLGHHDSTVAGTTTRTGTTGSGPTQANTLWRAHAVQDASATWGSLVPDIGSGHPYMAVGANSWQVGSTAGGLDYALIHASAGSNDNAQNVTTAPAAVGKIYQIDITLVRDTLYDAENDADALLDIALYRGADESTGASRTAAFDPKASGVQGSDLGTGGGGGRALLWRASQGAVADVLRFSLIIDFDEWHKTDALEGALDDGLAGFYTLIIGAHGGAAHAGVAYTLTTVSFANDLPAPVPVPGAVWLLGSALAGAGATLRRHQA